MPAAELRDVGLSEVSMRLSLHTANLSASENVCAVRNVFWRTLGQTGFMKTLWPNLISVRRKAAGMTMEQLAAKMDPPSSKGMISQYESGKRRPRQDTLASIAAALGTTPGALLDGHDASPIDGHPSVDVLQQMIAEVIEAELKFDHRIADLPHIVAPALHEQLERWRADYQSEGSGETATVRDKGARSRKPTKPSAKAGSRTA